MNYYGFRDSTAKPDTSLIKEYPQFQPKPMPWEQPYIKKDYPEMKMPEFKPYIKKEEAPVCPKCECEKKSVDFTYNKLTDMDMDIDVDVYMMKEKYQKPKEHKKTTECWQEFPQCGCQMPMMPHQCGSQMTYEPKMMPQQPMYIPNMEYEEPDFQMPMMPHQCGCQMACEPKMMPQIPMFMPNMEYDEPDYQMPMMQHQYGCQMPMMPYMDTLMPDDEMPEMMQGHQKSLIEMLDECSDTCQRTLALLMNQGGYGPTKQMSLLYDCANICENQIEFLMTQSEFSKKHAKICGDILDACGKENAMNQDMMSQHCANTCFHCAKACFDFSR